MLASLVTFLQHHPSLSYLFTGLFVGAMKMTEASESAREKEAPQESGAQPEDEEAPDEAKTSGRQVRLGDADRRGMHGHHARAERRKRKGLRL